MVDVVMVETGLQYHKYVTHTNLSNLTFSYMKLVQYTNENWQSNRCTH